MFHFVMGLRSEFEPIRAQLLGHSTLPIMAEALSAVIAEETRLRTIDAPSFVPQHSVLATPNQYAVMDNSRISKEKAKCKHCGGKTHPEERCFKKYPHEGVSSKACNVPKRCCCSYLSFFSCAS